MSLSQIEPESPEGGHEDVAKPNLAVKVLSDETEAPSEPAGPGLRSWLSSRRISGLLFRTLLAVLIGSLILRIASQAMGQMLQFYLAHIDRHYFNISYTARGFITASFFVTELLGSLVLGALSDRYGRKVFIILGPVFGAIAVQITSMTTAIWLLVITRLLAGLSTASSIPATLGYISEATSGRPKLRARIVGLFEITLFGGIAIGAEVAGSLFRAFGRQEATVAGVHLTCPAFSLDALLYLASLAVFAWGLRGLKEKAGASQSLATAHRQLQHYRTILRSRNVWQFVPAWLAINSIIGLWINHSVGLMTGKDQFARQLLTGNISEAKVGHVFFVLYILFAIGVLAWSFILGRYRRTTMMMIATGGLFATLLAIYGLNHLASFSSPLYEPLLGALGVGLLVLSGFTPAALTYLADVTEGQTSDRGSIMGLYAVFLGIGQLVGISLGGKFASWAGIDGLVMLSALLGLITAWTLIVLRRQEAPVLASA
ncbi:MAG TPA: MFS transporter [Blastocatellia bacterium]|jgi:MFS family permease|nr:MFS transporter [Blastocatellia bacterium]